MEMLFLIVVNAYTLHIFYWHTLAGILRFVYVKLNS